MPWWGWILVGFMLLAGEMLTPGGFCLLFFGLAGIVVGLLGLGANVTFVQNDAAAYCVEAAAAGERFAFAFIDHDHAYASVLPICRALPQLTLPGAFCLFHDWLDARNFRPEEAAYGVFCATRDGFDPAEFEFYGVFGVAGLYRRRL